MPDLGTVIGVNKIVERKEQPPPPPEPEVFQYDEVPKSFAEVPQAYKEQQAYFPSNHIGKLGSTDDEEEFTWMYNDDFAI